MAIEALTPPTERLVFRLRTAIADAEKRAAAAKTLNRPDLAREERDLALRIKKWLTDRGVEA
jgi:hypothetical protein